MKTTPKITHRIPLFALLFSLVLTLSALDAAAASPTPPDRMAYQGFLVDANGAALSPDTPGNYPVVFRIYDASTGGNILWSEQQVVTVDKGNFSVVLGEGTAVSGEARPALATVFTGATASDRYLGITVTIGATAKTLAPRLRWLPSPYAFTATAATSLVNNSGQTLLNLANGKLEGASDLTVTGNVGIGTTSPSTMLQIGQGANAGPGGLKINTGWINTSDPTENRPLDVQVRGDSKLTVNTQGNVGIGTTSPVYPLDVNGHARFGTTGQQIVFEAQSAFTRTAFNQLRFWDWDGGGDMVTFNNGNVGIGTTTPSATLHLNGIMKINSNNHIEFGADVAGKEQSAGKIGYQTFSPGNPGMLDIVGAGLIGVANNTRYIRMWDAVYITGWAAAPNFITQSDARIKQLTGRPVGEASLESIRRLQVADYRFLDTGLHGETPRRGLIAQEVENVLPNAVKQTTDFVPNIYSPAITSQFDAGAKTLTIDLKNPHGLNLGDMVRLNMANDQKALKVVAVPSPTRFVVEMESDPGKVFVFGKQVNDFRTVDYDHVFTTGISAIQELDRQVRALKKSEARVAELEAKVSRVDTLEREVAELEKKASKVETLEGQVAELRKLVGQLAAASQNRAVSVARAVPAAASAAANQ